MLESHSELSERLSPWIFGGAAILVCIFLLNFFMSRWLVSDKTQTSLTAPVVPLASPGDEQEKILPPEVFQENSMESHELTRRSQVVGGLDYVEHIFYKGHEEIARQKVYAHGKVEQTGQIPDGKVKFYDDSSQTWGEEYYWGGQREGAVTAYGTDGRVTGESKYSQGKLTTQREYYPDGKLRFEVDYRDARDQGDNKEVGIGKLYYPNGNLKFEWNITRSSSMGYKKSYNQDGTIRAEVYYDGRGNIIRKNP